LCARYGGSPARRARCQRVNCDAISFMLPPCRRCMLPRGASLDHATSAAESHDQPRWHLPTGPVRVRTATDQTPVIMPHGCAHPHALSVPIEPSDFLPKGPVRRRPPRATTSLRGAFKRGRCGRAPRRIKRPRSCHAAPPTHLPRPSRSSLQISGPRGPRGGRPPRGGCTVHWPALALPTVRFSVEPAIRAVPPRAIDPLRL